MHKNKVLSFMHRVFFYFNLQNFLNIQKINTTIIRYLSDHLV